MGRRRAVALIVVHLLIAAHVAHWLSTGRTVSPLEPSEAMEFAKHSVVNAGLIFFALTAVSTLVLGRFFCGWGCHLVALQDLCRWLLLRLGMRPRPMRSRALALVPLGAFVYMFLWPVWQRLQFGDSLAYRGTELTTEDFWATFPPWWVAVPTFLVCGFAAVYFLGSKGFCTYGCPYGALFGAVDRLAPGRIRVTDACKRTGHCSLTCSSNVDVAREVRDYGMVVDPGCMKCMDCVSVCPNGALHFGFGRPALRAKPREERSRPPRRSWTWPEELVLALAFGAVFASSYGLYGFVPFLLALGLGGLGAFGVGVLVRLVRRAQVGLPGLALKRDGRMTGAGRAFVVLAVGGLLLTADSAAVKVEGRRSAGSFSPLEDVRAGWFLQPTTLTPHQLGHARDVVRHGRNALALSLVNDGRRHMEVGWASLFLGDEAAFVHHLDRATRAVHVPAIAHVDLGRHWFVKGDLEGTAEHYAEALKIDPSLDFAYPALARVLDALGRGEEARAVLERMPRGER